MCPQNPSGPELWSIVPCNKLRSPRWLWWSIVIPWIRSVCHSRACVGIICSKHNNCYIDVIYSCSHIYYYISFNWCSIATHIGDLASGEGNNLVWVLWFPCAAKVDKTCKDASLAGILMSTWEVLGTTQFKNEGLCRSLLEDRMLGTPNEAICHEPDWRSGVQQLLKKLAKRNTCDFATWKQVQKLENALPTVFLRALGYAGKYYEYSSKITPKYTKSRPSKNPARSTRFDNMWRNNLMSGHMHRWIKESGIKKVPEHESTVWQCKNLFASNLLLRKMITCLVLFGLGMYLTSKAWMAYIYSSSSVQHRLNRFQNEIKWDGSCGLLRTYSVPV